MMFSLTELIFCHHRLWIRECLTRVTREPMQDPLCMMMHLIGFYTLLLPLSESSKQKWSGWKLRWVIQHLQVCEFRIHFSNGTHSLKDPLHYPGETDIHISRETIRPGWWGYAMRENAPFRDTINKWFGFSKSFKVVSYSADVSG